MLGRCQVRLKGAGLAVTSFSCLAGGLVILTASRPVDDSRPVRRATLLESLKTLEVFAWLWIAVGILCAVAMLWKRGRPMAFGLASALHLGWGFSYLAGWLLLDMPRAWVTACIYLIIAALVVIVAGIREELGTWEQR